VTIDRHHAFGGEGVSQRPQLMIRRALSALPSAPALAARRLGGYLLDPMLGRYIRAWRRFERETRIDNSCWLGPNAWCSAYADQTDPDRMEIRARATLRGLLRIEPGGRIVIGEDCYIGDDCILDSAESIRIGRYTWLAHGVSVFDNDSHPICVADRIEQAVAYREGRASAASRPASAPVLIGEHVWIGFNSFVSKGVTIGDRSIVGACSVVTKDVPPDSLVAGNPARTVRSICETSAVR
jgi:acetyltransferase-like isoleucine patch superfamily enzyme